LGLNPTTLSDGLMAEVREVAGKYAFRVDDSKILARSLWRKDMGVGNPGSLGDPVA
ncbi:MAG: NAD-dependent dehydratase, partial [Gammaproteobacteria bacterium]|nr:NAD-dependent dehydratase [Gammaproteobacteria bacterium]